MSHPEGAPWGASTVQPASRKPTPRNVMFAAGFHAPDFPGTAVGPAPSPCTRTRLRRCTAASLPVSRMVGGVGSDPFASVRLGKK